MMQGILHELTQLPGVRLAAIISSDGVPLCVLERSGAAGADLFWNTQGHPIACKGMQAMAGDVFVLSRFHGFFDSEAPSRNEVWFHA